MTINSQRFVWIAVVMLALTAASFAQLSVVVSFGPPPLPVYVQPPCPGDGYIWTPGYWAYDPDFGDYYWVPGTWVLAPQIGFLWTPGWWGWGGEGFIFHEGFWGPVVGFYGGINYGFGYFGHGYEGGRWENDHFYYNRAVNNVNVTNIHNVYNTTVINNTTVNRVSYNGGNGGITARRHPRKRPPHARRHIPPVAAQTQHVQTARANQQLRASVNHGKPPIAATPKPAAFQGSGVVPAKQSGGPYTPPPNRAANQPKANTQTQAPGLRTMSHGRLRTTLRCAAVQAQPQAATPQNNQAARPENNVPRPSTAVHPNELPPIPRPTAPNTGNAEQDQKYQQQQEQLRAQQAQERQKLQQQQEQEHQQLAQQKANQAKQQQLEQQHQQQTQELQQQHQQQQSRLARQQQQQMQARQQQPHASQPPKPKP